ncbi:hypothetical protein V5P93_000418 [Actinokineospora auranticolor]|uniref:Uncharacterized protein n=1 Tax=Actinokineospora auranticolor TaxID=155976 RepID=A0A2S6GE66_9PSEU|nr:hypothetical protein [Actinokineospora auranticolor]PPK63527.1 hypothetical protein CLV40_12754 [Actinokineospora auranticolor]
MPAPGTLGLDQLADKVGGAALYADLRRYYGVDLADLWHGTLTPRRVLWLIEHLPEDSAAVAALRGGSEHRAWTATTHLLATVVDAVQLGTWTTVAANSRRRPRPPAPMPRPTQPRRRAGRVVTVAEIAARQQHPGG